MRIYQASFCLVLSSTSFSDVYKLGDLTFSHNVPFDVQHMASGWDIKSYIYVKMQWAISPLVANISTYSPAPIKHNHPLSLQSTIVVAPRYLVHQLSAS